MLVDNFNKEIEKFYSEHKEVLKLSLNHNKEIISRICEKIIECVKNDKKIIFFGNGGSASDAQHLSTEFVSRFKMERKPIKSLAFTANTSTITAISNDYDYSKVFERQVEAFVEKGDVVIGISTSGTSKNVINGILKAKENDATTIVFVGETKEVLSEIADISLNIPSKNTARIQEMHILIGHIICEIVENKVFDSKQLDFLKLNN